ncbi:hypothetical protein H8E52_10530 [bacterium]|nr:hypothetical protein [bacterium]
MKFRTLAASLALMLSATASPAFYELGELVEDFTLLSPQGSPVYLSDFEGDVILINFFATW